MNPQVFMDCARAFARQSKCVSIQVGAVVVKEDHIISHGYNGTASGQVNCCDLHSVKVRPDMWGRGTDGSSMFEMRSTISLTPEGRAEHNKFSTAYEIHAEMNAIIFAAKHGLPINGATMYCTLSPCQECTKNIAQSGIVEVVYDDVYDKNPENWKDAFTKAGIKITHISEKVKCN
jgi:dCMP deaminase